MRNKNQFLNNLKFILWQFVFFFSWEIQGMKHRVCESPSISGIYFCCYGVAITRIEGKGNIVEVTRLYNNAYFNACILTM